MWMCFFLQLSLLLPALLCASALFYHIRSLTRTWLPLPYSLRCHGYLQFSVSARLTRERLHFFKPLHQIHSCFSNFTIKTAPVFFNILLDFLPDFIIHFENEVSDLKTFNYEQSY
jgi:hypothetical protein